MQRNKMHHHSCRPGIIIPLQALNESQEQESTRMIVVLGAKQERLRLLSYSL